MRDAYLGPEALARLAIDRQLEAAGWIVQSRDEINVSAGLGVALRDRPGVADPDYLLFVDGKACGTYEAKKEGWTLSGVERQSTNYENAVPDGAATWGNPLRFAYEGTGVELEFTDRRDPDPRARHVFAVHRPETLLRWLREETAGRGTLRGRLRTLPPVDYDALWTHQRGAIVAIEESLAAARARTLLVMATGSGKTYTAANLAYRLVKHGGAHRVLFLVDRRNLGEQAEAEFKQFVTPDEQRKFEELYGVQRLAGGPLRQDAKVVISTIQGVYAALAGVEFDEEDEEAPEDGPAPEVGYAPGLPPEAFDVIVVDEAHRSIYGRWKPVLEYFDAHLVGLTATPTNRTFGFFEKNLVFEYKHEQAVADGNNVPFEVYRIRTRIGEHGSTVEAGEYATFRDRATRKMQTELLDEDYDYDPRDLDRRVVATDQIRTVLTHFRDQLFAPADQGGIFPGRTVVPKTLIFAKDDSHADDIVREVRKVFGKGNDFCTKITSKSTGATPDELLKRFRNSFNPRIAVTVDLIATGTDVKAIECVFFMRAVKSRAYFEQMKGRGSRVMSDAEFQSVTDDAKHRAKTHFVIVDAVGVTDVEHHDTTPLERRKSVTLRKLMDKVGFGNADVDDLSSIMSRLTRIEKELTAAQRQQLADTGAGVDLGQMISSLLTAVDPDLRNAAAEQLAREQHGTDEPTDEQVADAVPQVITGASQLLRDNPKLRTAIVEVQSAQMQLIDEVSIDEVVSSGFDSDAGDRARQTVETWKQYIEEHRDQIDTFQVVYSSRKPDAIRRLKALAAEIASPPYRLSPEGLWDAYAALDEARVSGSPTRLTTELLSLLRYELGLDDELKPFAEVVEWRWEQWLLEQDAQTRFTQPQLDWLELMKDVITRSLTITREDFELDQALTDAGGLGAAWGDFDGQLDDVIAELNEQLAP